MANEVRLIDANALVEKFSDHKALFLNKMGGFQALLQREKGRVDELDNCIAEVINAPTVDAYTEEQVANIIHLSHQLHATNVELEKEVEWLKSCLNCKIRRECPRHCGKVVHDCDHWVYGDNAVEVVHGRWAFSHTTTVEKYDVVKCSNCGHEAFAIAIYVKEGHYCPNCGANMMDGDGNG